MKDQRSSLTEAAYLKGAVRPRCGRLDHVRTGPSRTLALLLSAVLAITMAPPAAAVTPLDKAGSMAASAGDTIGAAAGCGVAEARLLAVSTKSFELIEMSGASPDSIRRSQSIYEYFAARATAATRAKPELCPAAIAAFERAERG